MKKIFKVIFSLLLSLALFVSVGSFVKAEETTIADASDKVLWQFYRSKEQIDSFGEYVNYRQIIDLQNVPEEIPNPGEFYYNSDPSTVYEFVEWRYVSNGEICNFKLSDGEIAAPVPLATPTSEYGYVIQLYATWKVKSNENFVTVNVTVPLNNVKIEELISPAMTYTYKYTGILGDEINFSFTELKDEWGFNPEHYSFDGLYYKGTDIKFEETHYIESMFTENSLGAKYCYLEVRLNRIPQDYTVSFYDGNTLLEEIPVSEGESVEMPVNPKKDGHVFAGWEFAEVDETGNVVSTDLVFSEYLQVYANLKVIATWRQANVPLTITIRNYYEDGSSSQLVSNEGNPILLPQNPYVPDGYTWDGKYYYYGTSQEFTLVSMPSNNVDLYPGLVSLEDGKLDVPEIDQNIDKDDKLDEANDWLDENLPIVIGVVIGIAVLLIVVLIVTNRRPRRRY